MKNHAPALVLLAYASIGCAYVPPLPTEPSPTPTVRASKIDRLALTSSVEPSGKVGLYLTAYDETGNVTPSIDATCSASSGTVDPRRIVGIGSAFASWRDPAATLGKVTCSSGGVEAEVLVDLSAWKVSLGGFREELYAAYLEVRADPVEQWTFAELYVTPTTIFRPATLLAVDWGDGTVELLTGTHRTGAAAERIMHRYRVPGSFRVVGRAEWEGGAAEFKGTLTRTCIARGPAGPPLPDVGPAPYPFCWNSFTETK